MSVRYRVRSKRLFEEGVEFCELSFVLWVVGEVGTFVRIAGNVVELDFCGILVVAEVSPRAEADGFVVVPSCKGRDFPV